jgi:transcriptional regulator with GAF, ATPase, and Fis domain
MIRTSRSTVLNWHGCTNNHSDRTHPENRKLKEWKTTRLPPALSGKRNLKGLMGKSAPMVRLCELIVKISQNNSPVLLLGETGAGKELVARAIHFRGLRREQSLVTVDCSALTPVASSPLPGVILRPDAASSCDLR